MNVGLHVRVGSGYAASVSYAQSMGCTAVQFFSGNPKTYRVGPIDVAGLSKFREMRAAAGIATSAIHTSYLINLASEDEKMVANSLRLVVNDLAVAAAGGVDYVNTHLGSYGKRDRSEGFVSVAKALEAALVDVAPNVWLVLENSAGAGQLCGGTIEELGALVRTIDHPQLGICLDTAHSWAAGYEIDSAEGVDRFLAQVDEQVGIDRVKMFHFNDTQIPLGGHRDRHWHIGEGNIGLAGFRALVAHPALRSTTAILETPGEDADDRRNIDLVRTLIEKAAA